MTCDNLFRVPGLGLIHFGFGLGLENFLWPRPRPWPRAKLASLTSLHMTQFCDYNKIIYILRLVFYRPRWHDNYSVCIVDKN